MSTQLPCIIGSFVIAIDICALDLHRSEHSIDAVSSQQLPHLFRTSRDPCDITQLAHDVIARWLDAAVVFKQKLSDSRMWQLHGYEQRCVIIGPAVPSLHSVESSIPPAYTQLCGQPSFLPTLFDVLLGKAREKGETL